MLDNTVQRCRTSQSPWYPMKELTLTKRETVCVNLGSYNYLGFDDPDPAVTPLLVEHVRREGLSTGATRDNPEGTYGVHWNA